MSTSKKLIKFEYFCDKYQLTSRQLTSGFCADRKKIIIKKDNKVFIDEKYLLTMHKNRKIIADMAQKYYYIFSIYLKFEDAQIAKICSHFDNKLSEAGWYQFVRYKIFQLDLSDNILANRKAPKHFERFIKICDKFILFLIKNDYEYMQFIGEKVKKELDYI